MVINMNQDALYQLAILNRDFDFDRLFNRTTLLTTVFLLDDFFFHGNGLFVSFNH